MAKQSLAELRAENETEEPNEDATPQVEESKVEDVEVEEETEELETDADLNQEDETEDVSEDTEETEIEDWQKADDSNVEKKFTDGDIGAAKHKLRARMERKHETETDELKAEIERLKNATPVTPAVTARPKLSDFDDHDNPEEAFSEAFVDWRMDNKDAKAQAANVASDRQRQADQWSAETEKSLDQHYTRAAELSKTSGISEELYKSSDEAVRRLVDSVFPGNGDVTTDSLISTLGEGSEKVLYHVGVNVARQQELKDLLIKDKSGLKAVAYLGELKGKLLKPQKRKTNARKPAAQANGNSSKVRAIEDEMKKAYDKTKDLQTRISTKHKARKAGVDVSQW